MTSLNHFFELTNTDTDTIRAYKVVHGTDVNGQATIDLNLSIVLSGAKTTKIKKNTTDYGIIATALQRLYENKKLLTENNFFKIEVSYNAFEIGASTIPITPNLLEQRFITVTSSKHRHGDIIFDVYYSTSHGELDEIYTPGSSVLNIVNKVFSLQDEVLATKVLTKLHAKTKQGDYLCYNKDTNTSSVNLVSNKALEISNFSTRNTPTEVVTSRELTKEELSILLKTYKNHDDISLVVEIYDSINRFVIVDPKKTAEKTKTREVKFKKKDRDYKAIISAAHIVKTNKDGQITEEYDTFPGRVEMMVEYAIRQLFEKKKPIARGAIVGVEFTIYELDSVLKKSFGKTYSHADIRNAIEILHRSNIRLEMLSNPNEARFSSEGSTYLPYLSWGDESKRSFVSLHSVLMLEIGRVSYRGMSNFSIRDSKQYTQSNVIEKLLYLHWVNASNSNPYTIKMSTLLTNAGLMTENKKNNWKILQKAILKLSDNSDGNAIILPNPEIVVKKDGNKIVERVITFYPTDSFVSMQKKISKLKSNAIEQTAILVNNNNE
ncbi:hypothetical protein [Photobacterium kishitanii]|uniref:Uncharacterized protein n=1 Tax=Photobacterium kishitanii TaxID=318456 RepID=A0A2T3KLS1_9GAMM|nr:hypothetical protein [Photobacterium kishitanii]PSV00648.1 hypothetical protein C9J27_05785 [Photobacterium kishitanii]